MKVRERLFVGFGFYSYIFVLGMPSLVRPRTGTPLWGGSHVVHHGVVEDSAMTWPTRQFIMFILRWFGNSFQFRMVRRYIGTNCPRFVYYYGPTVFWDNVVPLILWMCIVVVVVILLPVKCFWFPFVVLRMRE